MDAASAGIAAAAALAGSAVTGAFAVKVSGDQIAAERGRLLDQLRGERLAAREERDQDRRLRAYVLLLDYVDWLYFCLDVRHRVLNRRIDALWEVRSNADFAPRPDSDEEKQAVEESGPTPEESKTIEEGPTNQEGTATLALATAVASDPVLKAFKELRDTQRALLSDIVRAEAAVLHPRPGKVDTAASDSMRSAAERYKAFGNCVRQIHDLVRGELAAVPEFDE
jgi:hypothetical protein